MPLLVDSGPLVALLDADDDHHDECVELLEAYEGQLVVPVLCVAEVSHLVRSSVQWQSEVRFLGALASGELAAEQLHPADLPRVAELVAHYHDLPLGTVDASVVAAAERLDLTTIATLDRRHFTAVRPAHAEAFELVP